MFKDVELEHKIRMPVSALLKTHLKDKTVCIQRDEYESTETRRQREKRPTPSSLKR
jgi:hypothetical protein